MGKGAHEQKFLKMDVKNFPRPGGQRMSRVPDFTGSYVGIRKVRKIKKIRKRKKGRKNSVL